MTAQSDTDCIVMGTQGCRASAVRRRGETRVPRGRARSRWKLCRVGRTGLQIETLVTTGSPAEAIGAIGTEHHVGLLIIGLGRTSVALGTRPGTVAYRVLCLATAPVLALPSRAEMST